MCTQYQDDHGYENGYRDSFQNHVSDADFHKTPMCVSILGLTQKSQEPLPKNQGSEEPRVCLLRGSPPYKTKHPQKAVSGLPPADTAAKK